MFSDYSIGGLKVPNPIDTNQLRINLSYKEGTIAEVQPVLSFDRLRFIREGVSQITKIRKEFGPYRQVPFDFRFNDRQVFNGYLTDFNFLLGLDQIEAKPVSLDSTDGLAELLSALDLSVIGGDLEYRDLLYKVKKVDNKQDLLYLRGQILVYSYILYTQLKEISNFISDNIGAGINAAPPGFAFGDIVRLILRGIALAAFLSVTLIQLIKQAKEAKELLFPKIRKTKVVTLHEMLSKCLSRVGYGLETDIEDMKNVGHWASGKIDKDDHFPRSSDRCGNTLGLFQLILDKYEARVAISNGVVYVYHAYSTKFFNPPGYKLKPFDDRNYKENVDDMIGTREILYSVDSEDLWTYEDFKGTEYIIRANIDDPTKSTVKGIDQREYGVALCSVNSEFNAVEKLWGEFVGFINQTISLFGGSNQALSIENSIGVAKVSSDRLGIAKLVYLQGSKIPLNHRDLLSAKSDELNYQWVRSHVRNKHAKKKIYEDILQIYNDSSLNCNLKSNLCFSPEGIRGEIKEIDWEFNRDNALVTFEIEDENRDTKLIETFYEPTK